MPNQPGDIYRVRWPYEVAVDREPYAIVLSEERFNDTSVVVVPLSTENLAESASRLALPDEILGRRSVAHADKLTRLDVANLIAQDKGPAGTIDEELLFDLHLAVGEALGAYFFPDEFEVRWKPPGSKQPERGSLWQAAWGDAKDSPRPGLVMSDWTGTDDHVILMPMTSDRPAEGRLPPSWVDLGDSVARADQVQVVRTHQLRSYEDRVDRTRFEAACRAIAHVIGAEL